MTEFRISLRPRLGQHLGNSLDCLAPLLATGLARRGQSQDGVADAQSMANDLLFPTRDTDDASPRGIALEEQAALHPLRQQAQDARTQHSQATDHATPHTPHLRLVPTDPTHTPATRSTQVHSDHGKKRNTMDVEARIATEHDPARGTNPQAGPSVTLPPARTQEGQSETSKTTADTQPTAPLSTTLDTMIGSALSRRQDQRSAGVTALGSLLFSRESMFPAAQSRVTNPSADVRAQDPAAQALAPTPLSVTPHGRVDPRNPAQDKTASGFARTPALVALDRAFPRHPDSTDLPKPSGIPSGKIDPADLRAAILELLEEDLLRHGLSPLGGS